jgi:regulator of sirC expression with transglutaminase-like and TPR domain
LREQLARLGGLADDDIDLVEAALALAALDRAHLPLAPYRRHLAKLTAEVGAYAAAARLERDVKGRAEALSHVIGRRYGYGCDAESYDDLEAANLMRVIDNRRGLPVVLGILYIHVARRLGWTATGLDFPSRFLVRLEHDGRRLILDPADGGAALDPTTLRALLKTVAGNDAELTPDHYRPAGNRTILYRMQNNIKVRLLKDGKLEEALRVIEVMALFAPGVPELWREAGLLNARLDNLRAAVAALEEFLRRGREDAERRKASALLQELRGRLN